VKNQDKVFQNFIISRKVREEMAFKRILENMKMKRNCWKGAKAA
jgi:hypothetical protein